MSTASNSDKFMLASGKVEILEVQRRADEAGAQDSLMEKDTTRPVAGGLLRPFKVRDFNLFTGGQTISIIGDVFFLVALPWLVLSNGGNAQELGIVMAAYGIPRAVCMLLGGWLSDSLRPRLLMLITDIIRALLVGILAALALWGHPTLWQLCAIAVPLGGLGGVFMPASRAILPEILSNDDLQAGNALDLSLLQGANMVGSAIAGVVVAAFTAGTGMAIDAASFVVSAISLALMRMATTSPVTSTKLAHHRPEQGVSLENPAAGVQEQGEQQVSLWHFLRTSSLIQAIFLVGAAIGLCLGGLVEVALPTLVHGPMHGGANDFGFIMAGWGAGALAGGIAAGMLGKLKRKGLAMLLAIAVAGTSFAFLPYVGIPGAVACMLVGGIAGNVANVQLFTLVQLVVPRHLLGRVMGVLMFAAMGTYPLSSAIVGVLSSRFGPVILFPLSGFLLLLVMLFGMTQKAMREY